MEAWIMKTGVRLYGRNKGSEKWFTSHLELQKIEEN